MNVTRLAGHSLPDEGRLYENRHQFKVEAIAPFGGVADISLRCNRCARWAVHIDRPITLEDLNQRADKHAEDCPEHASEKATVGR